MGRERGAVLRGGPRGSIQQHLEQRRLLRVAADAHGARRGVCAAAGRRGGSCPRSAGTLLSSGAGSGGGGGGGGGDGGGGRGGGAAAAAAAAAAEVDDLRFRFYARGLFASAFVTRFAPGTRGGGSGSIAGSAWECVWWAHMGLWGAGTLLCSALDWPARRCSGGRMAGATAEVLSSPGSYDARIAGDLWDVAGDAAGL
jgi:hypothetical protein